MNIIGTQFTGIATSAAVRAAAAIMIALSAGLLERFFSHAMKLFALYSEGLIFTAERRA